MFFGLSIRPSVRGHSNSVIFYPISSKFHIWIAFSNLPFKFEYGFCLTSDNQDGQQNGRHITIFTVVVTLTQSFLIRFLPNFIYELLPSTFRSSLNTGFVRHLITKMADKMATANQCPLSWSLLLSHFYRISSKFHIWIASIKLLFKFEYRFSLTNDNQNGRLSVCTCGQSTLYIYYPIASKFHIWITFIKLTLKL